jgi:hypothetical protein
MHSTSTPKSNDDPHDVVVVAPDAVRVAPSEDELSDLLHQAARHRVDSQTRAVPDFAAGGTVPPVDTTFRPAAVDDALVPGRRRSLGRGALRAFTALLVAGCIGVAAFTWRAWGDTAEKKIAKWVTQFVVTASLAPEQTAPAAQPAAAAAQAEEAVAPTAAAPSPDQAELLQSMARDLASLGQEVEQLKASIGQLKASQQQISRGLAKASEAKASEAKASEPNPRSRISAAPPRPAAAPAHRPLQPAQAAAPAPTQTGAPYYAPRQPEYAPRPMEPPPPVAAEPRADPELASVPRPPMPLR